MISITRIVAPNLWGWLADKTQRRMAIVKMGVTAALGCFAFIYFADSMSAMVLVVMGYTFFLNAVMSQFDVLTLRFLGENHARYGAIRLWGSLGFVAAVLLGGWVFDVMSIQQLPVVVMIGLFVAAALPWSLKEPSNHEHVEGALPSQSFLKTLRLPATLAFLFAAFLLQVSHAPYYTFFSLYLEQHGYVRMEIGLLWAFAVMAEVLMFTQTHRLLRRFSVRQLLLVSLILAGVRWSGTATFVDNVWLLLLFQALHAFTFAVFHAASVDYVRQNFSARSQGQAQSLLNATGFGAGAAMGAYGSGLLWDRLGLQTYYLAALASVIGAFAILYYVKSSTTETS